MELIFTFRFYCSYWGILWPRHNSNITGQCCMSWNGVSTHRMYILVSYYWLSPWRGCWCSMPTSHKWVCSQSQRCWPHVCPQLGASPSRIKTLHRYTHCTPNTLCLQARLTACVHCILGASLCAYMPIYSMTNRYSQSPTLQWWDKPPFFGEMPSKRILFYDKYQKFMAFENMSPGKAKDKVSTISLVHPPQ